MLTCIRGHQPRTTSGVVGTRATQEFVREFVTDVRPNIESHDRVRKNRVNWRDYLVDFAPQLFQGK
jgi:hypothetical protein